jgi:predicted nucleic acid-binding protein
LRFWDTSALVPLMVAEESSQMMRDLLRADDRIVVSSITTLEITGTLWRLRHHDQLQLDAHERALKIFADLSSTWREIVFSQGIADLALDLFSRRPVRTLDSIQLATALSLRETSPLLSFVTLDRKLNAAAFGEGFDVLP